MPAALLRSAPWRRAPILLLRRPALLLSVAAVGVVLGLAGAAGPLFLSSIGSAVVAEDLSEGCPATAGLRVNAAGAVSGEYGDDLHRRPAGADDVAARERSLERLLARSGAAAMPVELTAIGPPVDAVGLERTRVVLVHRESIEDKVDVVATAPGPGVWIPESASERSGAGAGDDLALAGFGGRQKRVRVAGVYRDVGLPLPDEWCAFGRLVFPAGFQEAPARLLLADRATFAELERTFETGASSLIWEVPIETAGLTLPQASATADRFDSVVESLRTDHGLVNSVVGADSAATRLPDFVEVWERTIRSVGVGVVPVVVAALAVCLLFVASVGRSWCAQREAEVALLVARGVAPSLVGLKAVLEAVPALAVGTASGWAAATAAVRMLGPSSLLDRGAVVWSVALAAGAAAVGAVVAGVVVTARTRAVEEPRRARQRVRGGLVSELMVAAGAAAAWWRLAASEGELLRQPTGAPGFDVVHLLFPLLAIAAVGAVGIRLLVRLLPALRRVPSAAPVPLYLAARRLVADRGSLHVLAVAATVAAGLIVCSTVIVSSVGATLNAKASLFVGGASAAELPEPVDELPPALAGSATSIGRWMQAHDQARQRVEVIGVDRETFGDGAFWDRSLADRSLGSLLDDLADTDGEDVPVILVDGGGRPVTSLTLGPRGRGVEVPVRVVASLDSFPGQRSGRPLVVGDLEHLRVHRRPSVGEVWADGDVEAVVASLRDAGLTVWGDVSAGEVLGAGTFRTTAWTFGFLRAVGALLGVLTVAGLLAHLAGRERRGRLGYALARRFGLRRLTNVVALAVEALGVVVSACMLGGTTGLVVASVVHGRLDALRRLPPAPLLRVPSPSLAATFAVTVAAVLLGCWLVQRTSDRASVVEVLRADG